MDEGSQLAGIQLRVEAAKVGFLLIKNRQCKKIGGLSLTNFF